MGIRTEAKVAPRARTPTRPTSRAIAEVTRRIADLFVACAGVLLLAPLLIVIIVIVRHTTPGPALFRQQRLGKDRRFFEIYKFRTMYVDVSEESHRQYVTEALTLQDDGHALDHDLHKLTDDPRITRVGAFLRQTSMDELPQLLNVIKGDMALVGPRPCLSYECDLLRGRQFERFAVKPGLTGLWQVSGRSSLTFREALDLDVEYVTRRSLALDMRILLKTVPVVLFRRGAAL
jgi:lipopolysaccharide/colanic/teichoic acid biosynthesis glycosyltransferase